MSDKPTLVLIPSKPAVLLIRTFLLPQCSVHTLATSEVLQFLRPLHPAVLSILSPLFPACWATTNEVLLFLRPWPSPFLLIVRILQPYLLAPFPETHESHLLGLPSP